MDAVTALLSTAKGARRSLGAFSPPQVTTIASALLETIAEELAEVGRDEAALVEDATSPEETMTGPELIAMAIDRRAADLFDALGDRITHATVGEGRRSLMLLLPDSFLREQGRRLRRHRRGHRDVDDDRDGFPPPDEGGGPGWTPPDEGGGGRPGLVMPPPDVDDEES